MSPRAILMEMNSFSSMSPRGILKEDSPLSLRLLDRKDTSLIQHCTPSQSTQDEGRFCYYVALYYLLWTLHRSFYVSDI